VPRKAPCKQNSSVLLASRQRACLAHPHSLPVFI
jgi:hypothetical protein